MSTEIRVSEGMVLRAGTSGYRYRVTGVGDERVVANGPHGSLGVSREELEQNIRDGRVTIERWP